MKLTYAITILSALAAIQSSMGENGALPNGAINGAANGAVNAPDGGSTIWLLGIGLAGLAAICRKRMSKSS